MRRSKKILDECKADLENSYEERANGLIVRARARWHEYGEKSTKYFLSLEKRNYTRKHIRKLCLSGVITKKLSKNIGVLFGVLQESIQ